jgi:FkbM family methyltransferase
MTTGQQTKGVTLAGLQTDFNAGCLDKQNYIARMYDLHRRLFEYANFIRNTDIAAIEISRGQVIMTSAEYDIRVVCEPDDMRIAPIETLNFGFYEPEEAGMLMRLAAHARTVFDIGANIGWYSLAIAKHYPETAVFAFEPIPHHFQSLKGNISLNGLTNVRACNMGLSSEAGTLRFYVNPAIGVNASMRNVADAADDALATFECEVRRLDDFVLEKGVAPDLIKCDVEGAEYLVLQGARKTISTHYPMMMTELLRKWSKKFDYHPNEMLGFLRDLGYEAFFAENGRLAPFGLMDDETVQTNFFFLHTEKHADIIEKLSIPTCMKTA